MFDIDPQTLQRLTELDQQLAPLLAEARAILDQTRPGFYPFAAWTFAGMYTARAVGPTEYYARQREKAAATRRRNLEVKRLSEPPAPKPKKRSYFAPYARRKAAKVS